MLKFSQHLSNNYFLENFAQHLETPNICSKLCEVSKKLQSDCSKFFTTSKQKLFVRKFCTAFRKHQKFVRGCAKYLKNAK